MKGSPSNKDAKIQHWTTHPGRNFQNRHIWKHKIWQNFGAPQRVSPSNEDAKIHNFYLCKLNTSQFQDTQANMKEK